MGLQQLDRQVLQRLRVRKNYHDEVNGEYDPSKEATLYTTAVHLFNHTTGNWRPAFEERVFAFERAFPLPATFPRPDIAYHTF